MGASTSLLPVDDGVVAVDDEVGEENSEYGLAAHRSLLYCGREMILRRPAAAAAPQLLRRTRSSVVRNLVRHANFRASSTPPH